MPAANDDLVPEADACPRCGERHQDLLVWIAPGDDRVRCSVCTCEYEPMKRAKEGDDEQR